MRHLKVLGYLKEDLERPLLDKDLNPQKLNKVNEAASKYVKTTFDESRKKKVQKKDE